MATTYSTRTSPAVAIVADSNRAIEQELEEDARADLLTEWRNLTDDERAAMQEQFEREATTANYESWDAARATASDYYTAQTADLAPGEPPF